MRHDRTDLVQPCVLRIKEARRLIRSTFRSPRAGLKITRGAPKGLVLWLRDKVLKECYPLPDTVLKLQESTSLPRTTTDIFLTSQHVGEFLNRLNDDIKMATECIVKELAYTLIDGIQYEPIDGRICKLRELKTDGIEKTDRLIH